MSRENVEIVKRAHAAPARGDNRKDSSERWTRQALTVRRGTILSFHSYETETEAEALEAAGLRE